MKQIASRIKGVTFLLWHSRHFAYHIGIGMVYSYVVIGRFSPVAVIGSLLPDVDHIFYFFMYGKNHWYSREIRALAGSQQWRKLWTFIERGHKKYQTNLATHNVYIMGLLLGIAITWPTARILFGSLFLHYFFDMTDDIVQLGYVNKNWWRWGLPKGPR